MAKIKHQIYVPKNVSILHDKFKEHGYELYLVGGCVRDSVMRVKPKDYDLATNINPDEIINVVKNIKGLKYVDEDSRFGVIRVIFDGVEEYELVTFRSDGEYLDNRRPDSVTFGSIEMDAARRDFTMNAMYYNLSTNEIIDFHGGMSDIDNNKLRFVGNASERLSEDPLRLLRAIRFCYKYNMFIDMDILRPFSDLNGVTPERIRKEFVSASKSKNIDKKRLIQMFVDAGVFEKVFGFDTHLEYDNMVTDINFTYVTLFAYFLHIHNFRGDVKKHLIELKYSRNEAEDIFFIFRMIRMEKSDLYDLMKYIQRKNYNNNDLEFLNLFLTPKKQQWLLGLLFGKQYNSESVAKKYNVSGLELGQKLRELHTEAIIKY